MGNLLIPYRGVIEIVADYDVGKTIAALQTVYPYDNVVFIDDDEKGAGTVQQMVEAGETFGQYVDLGERRTKLGSTPNPTQILDEIIYPVIAEVTKSHRDVIIFDTWNIVYKAARLHVEANKEKYTHVVGNWHGNSPIVQGKISRIARDIELKQLNELRSKCDLLILTHHLKDNYENNVKIGKVPESSKTFAEVCNMRLWLKRNARSKVPTILFLKRPSVPKVEKGKLNFVNVVPMKIIPTDKDESIWTAIQKYEKNPIESRKPTEEETPTSEEFAMLSGTLTPDQKSYVLEVLKYQKEEAEEVQEIVATVSGDWQSLPEKEIAKEIDNTFNGAPKTGAEFLAKAMSEFGMNAVSIKDKIDVGLDKILKSSQEELREYWKGLQK